MANDQFRYNQLIQFGYNRKQALYIMEQEKAAPEPEPTEPTPTPAPAFLPDAIVGDREYDNSRSLYNMRPDSLRRFRGAMGRALAGSGFCDVVCVGPSTTEGFPGPLSTSWPRYLETLLRGRGLTSTASGFVWVNSNGSPIRSDERWAFNGFTFYNGLGFKAPSFRSTAAGQTATFTSNNAGTVVEFIITGAWGAYTYTIDNGAPVEVAPGGDPYGGATVVTVEGLPNTTHKVVITATTNTGVFVSKARVRGANSGLYFHGAGWGGSRVSEWDMTTTNNLAYQLYGLQPSTFSGIPQPHLVIFDASIWLNDYILGGLNSSQSKAGLGRLIGQFRDRGADVLMMNQAAPDPNNGFQAYPAIADAVYREYRQMLYDLSGEAGVPLIDMPDRHGDFAQANASGLMADPIHPNAAGYAAAARALESVIAA